MSEYSVIWKGTRSGPYTKQQIVEMIEAGEISEMHAVYVGSDLVDIQDLANSAAHVREQTLQEQSYQQALAAAEFAASQEAEENQRLREQLERGTACTSSLTEQHSPPPVGAIRKLEIAREGAPLGSFSKSEIQAGLKSGRFFATDQLCDPDDQSWITIFDTGEFQLPVSNRTSFKSKQPTTMSDKKTFLSVMRSNTAYPVFRQVVSGLAIIGYGLAAICVISGIVLWITQLARQNDTAAWMFLIGGFGYSLGITILTILYQGFLGMIADIADSMVDMNQRNKNQ